MSAVLEARHVSKTYGRSGHNTTGVDGVTLQVVAGEAVALMGPSGCGKSTLLALLGLISVPTQGEILVDGEGGHLDTGRRAHLRNDFFGFLHQDFAIVENETVERNVGIPLEYARPRPGRAQRRARSRALLAEVGLAGTSAKNASHLSGGERQRVAIARALVNDPVVVLADEPTAALDTSTARDIMALLLMVRKRGGSLVVATHDPRVAAHCDRVVGMLDGRLADLVTPFAGSRSSKGLDGGCKRSPYEALPDSDAGPALAAARAGDVGSSPPGLEEPSKVASSTARQDDRCR